MGHSIDESEEAWRKVISYEPRNLFALTHLARILVADGRSSAIDSLLAPFAPQELRTDRRLEEIVLLRALMRGYTATIRSVSTDMRRWESLSTWRVAAFLTAFTPDPARMQEVDEELTQDNTNGTVSTDLHWFAS